MSSSATTAAHSMRAGNILPQVSGVGSVGDKGFKRKFEDALYNLDKAVEPSATQPSKKTKLTHSVYSTLAKYGIKRGATPQTIITGATSKSRLESLSKTAPHLVFLLNRGASRRRKDIPFKPAHTPLLSVISAPPTASEYRPSSTSSFLSRLSTFKLTTYANKPPAIDAVAASKCGWVNEGKDRLVCGICAVSWVVANRDGMGREAATTLLEKQRVSLVEMHKDGCPWKSKQCEDSIYCVPLQTPSTMTRELKSRASKLDLVLKDVQIKHPLLSTQTHALTTIIRSITLIDDTPSDEATDSPFRHTLEANTLHEPSETAILAALFGWTIVLPTAAPKPSGHTSISRSSSVAPSVPSTPIRPRVNSARTSTPRISTPVPGTTSPSLVQRATSSLSVASVSPSTLNRVKADTTLLFCPLCQRRIGLWAFVPCPEIGSTADPLPSGPSLAGETTSQPRRQLDVLKEHRSYCPYVIKSTILPSLPVPPTGRTQILPHTESYPSTYPSAPQATSKAPVEGWRAVMSMVLRYGAVHKQRLRRSRGAGANPVISSNETPEIPAEDIVLELDQIEQMVQGVKAHGGRDLLRYVKGLLG